jgi:hypothetical protein
MKRLAGQAGKTVGWVLHHTGMIFITVFFVLAALVGAFAFRLSEGPVQIPWLTSRLASIVSGQGIDVHIDRAALAWGGYRAGGPVPLYLKLSGILVRNAAGVTLGTIRDGRLVFYPSALLGGRAPILVSSQDAYFQGSNVPVGMQAAIELNGFLTFAHADIAVKLGEGDLGAAGMALPITSGRFNVSVSPSAVAITDGVFDLAPRGSSKPVLGLSGQARLTDAWHGTVSLTLDALAADDLAAYWPPSLLVQTRDWVTHNISAGAARDAKFTIGLSAPKTLARVSLDSAHGAFSASGISVGWIPHAQLITGVGGTLTFIDDNDIAIAADAGDLGGLNLAGGTMQISGLLQHTQLGSFKIPVTGTLPEALKLLAAPPLSLLTTAPPALLSATGGLNGTVAASLPLRGDVTLAQVDLHVAMNLSGVTLPIPAAGLSLTDGALALSTTTRALSLQGGAKLDGQDAAVSAQVAFGGKIPAADVSLSSVADKMLLQRYGLDSDVTGGVPFSVRVTQGADGQTAAVLTADLTPAALAVPAFGWRKTAGAAGHVTVSAALNQNAVTGVSAISATAPGLDVQAQADPVAGKLDFSALRIGATSGQGSIAAPAAAGKPWAVVFSGPELDLSGYLKPAPVSQVKTPAKAPPATAATPSGPLWSAKLAFQKLVLAGNGAPALAALTFAGNGQGASILAAQAAAAEPDGQMAVAIAPAQGAQHPENLHLTADDGGFLLRALGDYRNIDGGALDLTATAEDDGTQGVVRLQKFRLMKAPEFAKVLQSLTVYGVASAASGPGLQFDTLVAPFGLAHNVLTLTGARAFSSSLGFTASGTIDLSGGSLALSTTIIPAYALNSLPGRIPVVGKLFSAEKGGGLFAVRAHISGSLADPDVTVNPLSALTPGVLRDMFGGGGAAEGQ